MGIFIGLTKWVVRENFIKFSGSNFIELFLMADIFKNQFSDRNQIDP